MSGGVTAEVAGRFQAGNWGKGGRGTAYARFCLKLRKGVLGSRVLGLGSGVHAISLMGAFKRNGPITQFLGAAL